jgi:heme/copper-type cytochrome/quinol oxidase subunit 3
MEHFIPGENTVQETETRKPSKVQFVLLILLVLLLILCAVFIALYVVERKETESTDSSPETCSSPACITNAAGMLEVDSLFCLLYGQDMKKGNNLRCCLLKFKQSYKA